MAKNDGGDKTEKPTPQRLKDARKKGDVAKSREVTSTVGLVIWLALGAGVLGYASTRIVGLLDGMFLTIGQGWTHTGFAGAARTLGGQAAEISVLLVAILLVPVAAVGLLTDFLQAGPVLTFEKIKPKMDSLNPVEGIKRMFSMDNIVEVVKAIAKTALLFLVGWLVIKAALPDMIGLARSASLPAQVVGMAMWDLTVKLMAWTIVLFALISILDWGYQRYSFEKKNRMSLRDIREEMKESEGDPHIKQQRKQAHQEWSQRNAASAAQNANVLVVNPTHIAIAIEYNRETAPVPTISAKGEDHVARAMREAAEEAGVPIVRNVPLARDLLRRGEEGEIIPADLFDIIAEVILWAREVRTHVEAARSDTPTEPLPPRRIATPGEEDLTRYSLNTSEETPWNRSH